MTSGNSKLVNPFHFVLNNIPFAILLENKHRILEFVNQNFCHLFGFPLTPEQMVGTNCIVAVQMISRLFENPSGFVETVHQTVINHSPVSKELVPLANGQLYLRDYLPIFQDGQLEGHL